MLRHRPNLTVRRPAYRMRPFRAQPPPRRRGFANNAASSALGEIGRGTNELGGIEARARTELSQLQRQKLEKKTEYLAKMSTGEMSAEDIAALREAEQKHDADLRFGDAVEGGPIATGIDAKLAKKSAKLQATGDTDAAGDAYAQFDAAERQFYDELPAETKPRESMKSDKKAAGAKTAADKKRVRVSGNFEGDMAPIEGIHDEAEELAGRRGPYLRQMSKEEMQPLRKRDRRLQQAQRGKHDEQQDRQQYRTEESQRDARLAMEQRLVDQAEQEAREEAATFQDLAHSAVDTVKTGASAFRETVLPKVAAGAALLKEKLSSEVVPKAKESAAKLKEKVTEEIAPKAMDKAKEAATQLKHKVTDDWAPKAAEMTKEATARMGSKMMQSAPSVAEKVKEAASAAKDKAMDAVSATKEKLSEKLEEAPSVSDVAANLKDKASGAVHKAAETVKDGAAYAKEKVNEASEKADQAPFSLDAMGLRQSSWNFAKEKAGEAAEKLKEGAEYAMEKTADVASDASEKVKDAAAAARKSMESGSMSESASNLKDRAASALHTAEDKAKTVLHKAEEKYEEMRDKPNDAESKGTMFGDAAQRATQAMDTAGARVWEKAMEATDVLKEKTKSAGEALAQKAAESAHNVRVAAQEKLMDAAHRLADKTSGAEAAEAIKERVRNVAEDVSARSEEWASKEKSQEQSHATEKSDDWTQLKVSAAAVAGSMAASMKEKMRAGVHQAAHKVEEVLANNAKGLQQSGKDSASSFDLRAENQRVEETAADALEREASAAMNRTAPHRRTYKEAPADTESEHKAEGSKKEAHRRLQQQQQQHQQRKSGRRQHEARA